MTNLEKALFQRIEELEKQLNEQNKFASDLFDSNVRMSGVLCAVEDHLVLLKGDERKAVFMENVVEGDGTTDFDKIYECFKNSLEQGFNDRGDDDGEQSKEA